jgi:hypothetical protein
VPCKQAPLFLRQLVDHHTQSVKWLWYTHMVHLSIQQGNTCIRLQSRMHQKSKEVNVKAAPLGEKYCLKCKSNYPLERYLTLSDTSDRTEIEGKGTKHWHDQPTLSAANSRAVYGDPSSPMTMGLQILALIGSCTLHYQHLVLQRTPSPSLALFLVTSYTAVYKSMEQ